MDPLHLDRFRLPVNGRPSKPRRQRPPRPRQGDWFIKGPIPGAWLARAASLDGKTLHLSLALWYLAGIKKSREFKLTRDALERFGVGRSAVARGLERLEAAGLVGADRGRGRLPVVTLLDVQEASQ